MPFLLQCADARGFSSQRLERARAALPASDAYSTSLAAASSCALAARGASITTIPSPSSSTASPHPRSSSDLHRPSASSASLGQRPAALLHLRLRSAPPRSQQLCSNCFPRPNQLCLICTGHNAFAVSAYLTSRTTASSPRLALPCATTLQQRGSPYLLVAAQWPRPPRLRRLPLRAATFEPGGCGACSLPVLPPSLASRPPALFSPVLCCALGPVPLRAAPLPLASQTLAHL